MDKKILLAPVDIDDLRKVYNNLLLNRKNINKNELKKINLSLKSTTGTTFLHLAARDGNLSLVKNLILQGADVNICDAIGETPLHEATKSPNSDQVIQMLFLAGADLNKKDLTGGTPLHTALEYSNVKSVKTLVDIGADLNLQNKKGFTPLHTAVLLKNVEATQILLNAKPKVNIKNKSGLTPLHLAIFFYNRFNVKALLAAGADVNILDKKGNSPKDYVRMHRLAHKEKIVRSFKRAITTTIKNERSLTHE